MIIIVAITSRTLASTRIVTRIRRSNIRSVSSVVGVVGIKVVVIISRMAAGDEAIVETMFVCTPAVVVVIVVAGVIAVKVSRADTTEQLSRAHGSGVVTAHSAAHYLRPD